MTPMPNTCTENWQSGTFPWLSWSLCWAEDWPMSDEEIAFLEDVAERMEDSQNIPCTDCKYCMPCQQGIDIPSQMRFIDNYVEKLKQGKF